MGIPPDSLIERDQADAMMPSRCHNQLVSRVRMKTARKRTRLRSDVGRQREQRHPRIGKRREKPIVWWHRKSQSPPFHKFRDLPARDRTDANGVATRLVDDGLQRPWQPVVSVNPPNPDVGVEQNHRAASQSFSSTPLKGASYSTGSPANGRAASGSCLRIETG